MGFIELYSAGSYLTVNIRKFNSQYHFIKLHRITADFLIGNRNKYLGEFRDIILL